MKGNFSKAISGVLVSEWVGVDSFGRGGGERGGCIHSLLDGEKCSAAEMHSKVFFGGGLGKLHEFHDYQVLWLVCGFGLVGA